MVVGCHSKTEYIHVLKALEDTLPCLPRLPACVKIARPLRVSEQSSVRKVAETMRIYQRLSSLTNVKHGSFESK